MSDRFVASWLGSEAFLFFVDDERVWMMDSGMEVDRFRRTTSSCKRAKPSMMGW